MPKITASKSRQRHAPLSQDILQRDAPRASARMKQRSARKEEEEEVEQYVESKMTGKILKQAREQQVQQDAEDDDEAHEDGQSMQARAHARGKSAAAAAATASSSAMVDDSDEEAGEEEEEEGEQDGENFLGNDEDFEQHLKIDPEDEEALRMFMPRESKKQATLADLILGKIREKETELASRMSEAAAPQQPLDERIVRVYESVGEILSKYRSGKLPKAFKIIASLKNWEEVLHITQPESWTAAAMFQATRVFASNLNARMAQRFYSLVLLPRVRDDIMEYKRLNFQLFMALKKALFKPAAFYKGILLPLCEAGDCTLREAVIVSGVLARTSVPVLQSAAAMLKIAEMPYNGANSIFLRVLLDKKYALPYRVIDALVFHFVRFTSDQRVLPVLWHQCLLVFVQRYKEDISSEQKEALLALLRSHVHPKITPEIRREVLHSRSRDAEHLFGGDEATGGAAGSTAVME